MLATRVRVSPCSERCSPESEGRTATSVSPSRWNAMAAGIVRWRDAFGPLTRTNPGSMSTSTPLGTVMGILPIRLIAGLPRRPYSPDVGDDFAAHTGPLGLSVGHHARRRRQDGNAHAAEHLRELGAARVDTAAGLGDALDARDRPRPALPVLQANAEGGVAAVGHRGLVVGDVALRLQDARDLDLHLRQGHLDRVVLGPLRVADAGKHVCDGIRHGHGRGPPGVVVKTGPYQLALVIPGTSPRWARSRKHRRH